MIQLFDIKKAKKDLKTRDNEILKKYLDLSNKDVGEVLSICNSSETGLNQKEVKSRLLENGKNVVVKEDNKSPLYFLFMSFKDEFLQNEGYIDTSLSYGNFYLNDPNLPVQQNTKITTRINYNSGFGGYSIVMNCLNIGTQMIAEKTETPAT